MTNIEALYLADVLIKSATEFTPDRSDANAEFGATMAGVPAAGIGALGGHLAHEHALETHGALPEGGILESAKALIGGKVPAMRVVPEVSSEPMERAMLRMIQTRPRAMGVGALALGIPAALAGAAIGHSAGAPREIQEAPSKLQQLMDMLRSRKH